MADPLFPGDQPLLDALALMDEHTRLRAKAAAAERLAEALRGIKEHLGPVGVGDASKDFPAKDQQAVDMSYGLAAAALKLYESGGATKPPERRPDER